jgi:triosephosphate isomerase
VLINKKAQIALKNNLTPLICIGETLEERKNGDTLKIIKAQLDKIYNNIDVTKTLIAYEPVWAIGSGLTPNNTEIIEVHKFISEYFNDGSLNEGGVKILYGGSVNEANCDEIMNLPYVSGVLVGGASLIADKFIKIANFLQK